MTVCGACAFETDRLSLREWHSVSPNDWPEQDLTALVVGVMTEPVTRSLPSPWQGQYTVERAVGWIAERDGEGTTLLVLERATRQAVGLVMLFESAADDGRGGVDVRLGYLLAESAWGKGLASELLGGLVTWCRAQDPIRSLAGGVARENVASARVLEKNGFRPVEAEHGDPRSERLFELRLPRSRRAVVRCPRA
jgi:RimJ/RimL family protein N-acetyltransferase